MGNYIIPEQIKDSIDRYVETGCQTGGFLNAVLSNDLKESFSRADNDNRICMFEIVKYLYNDVPGDCWGSPRRVKEWIKRGGLKGRPKTAEETPCTT